MTQWFYRTDETSEKGPVSPAELLELIRKGTIQEQTLIRKGDSPWVASIEINGLWEAVGRPSVGFDCPHCGKPITKPPVRCTSCNQTVQHATGHLVHHQSSPHEQKSHAAESRAETQSRFGTRPGLYD